MIQSAPGTDLSIPPTDLSIPPNERHFSTRQQRGISPDSTVGEVYKKNQSGSRTSASPSYKWVTDRNKRIITDPESIERKLRKQSIIADRQRTFQPSRNLSHDRNHCLLEPFKRIAFDPNTRNAFDFLSTTIPSPSIWNNVSCETEIASLSGSKSSQEDVGIASSFTLPTPDGKTHAVFLSGIFDGHGGPGTALFIKANLQKKLENTFGALFNKTLPNLHPLKPLENETTLSDVVIWNVLKIACVELHEECRKTTPRSGTTAAFSLLINGDDLWHANIGDSRSFITSGRKTIQLSEDMKSHFSFERGLMKQQFEERFNSYFMQFLKDSSTNRTINYPYNNYERSIWKRGGFVSSNNRLNEYLAPARALGDLSCGNALCPRPKITKTSLLEVFDSADSVVLVHASDGLWDAATTDEVAAEINSDQNEDVMLADTIKDLAYSAVSTIDKETTPAHLLGADNTTIVATKLDLHALRHPPFQEPSHPSGVESNCSCIVS